MIINKKGFTLVELLAVIVILAVVMLIGVTAVGPLMTRARKSALGTEGIGIVDAAKMAYQAEQLNGSSIIKPTSSVCFDLRWLCTNKYFEKGCDGYSTTTGDKYTGSVLVSYASGKYTYKYWISNGVYVFANIDPSQVDANKATDGTTASANCGSASTTGLVKCTGTSTTCS